MLCQVCGQAEASVQIIEIVDGDKRTLAFCASCASQKEDVIDPGLIKAANEIKKALGGVAAAAAAHGLGAAPASPSAVACPECGITWKEFRSSNRFGCPHDYEMFADELEALLQKIHGATHHRGRRSDRALLRRERNQRRKDLRRDLDAAIRSEDYERAAMLRDRLQELQQEERPEGDDGAAL